MGCGWGGGGEVKSHEGIHESFFYSYCPSDFWRGKRGGNNFVYRYSPHTPPPHLPPFLVGYITCEFALKLKYPLYCYSIFVIAVPLAFVSYLLFDQSVL